MSSEDFWPFTVAVGDTVRTTYQRAAARSGPSPADVADRAVAGTWNYERGRVEIAEFAPLPPATRREVERAAEALAGFHS